MGAPFEPKARYTASHCGYQHIKSVKRCFLDLHFIKAHHPYVRL
jgi:hypothetical protein